MKRIFLLVLIFLLSKVGFGQYPITQNLGSDSTKVLGKGAIQSRFINTNFVDSNDANVQRISQYPGAQIYTSSDNKFLLRNSTATAWIDVTAASSGGNKVDSVTFNSSIRVDTVKYWINGAGYVAGLIDKDCGLISPGVVAWDSLLVFSVSPSIYCIDGTRYTSPQSNVTLSAADGSNPRIDVIAANSSGVIVVVEGTPAANPVKPQVDPSTQLELTYILVPAGATTPGGIASVTIYDENIEWTTSSQNVTVDYDNTADPYHLTKAGSTGAITSSSTLIFTNSSTINLSQYSSVSFFVKLKSTFSNNVKFDVYWGNSGNKITDAVTVSNGTYGFTRTNTSSYQQITIPISAFTFEGGTISDVLYIQTTGSNASGFYIDWVRLQGGIPGGGGGNYVTSVFRKTGTDSVFQVINNIPVFAFIDSSGGVNIYNSDGTQTDATRTYDAAEQDLIFDNIKYFFVKMGSEGEVTKVISLGDPGYADEGNIQLINDGFGNATFQLFSKDSTNDIQNTISSNSTDHRTDLIVQDNNTLARSILSQYVDSFSLRFNATGYGSNLGIKLTKDSLMFKNVPYTLSTTGKKVVLRDTTTGLVENIDPALLAPTITASNGLTKTGDNIALGGTALSANTSIPTSIYTLTLNSTGSAVINGINGGSGDGIGGYASGGGSGVVAQSSSGFGISATTNTGTAAGSFVALPSSTSTAIPLLFLSRSSTGTAANGIGGSIDFYNKTTGGTGQLSNRLISKLTDATDATRTSQFDITGVNSATTETFANFQTGGIVRVNNNADTLAKQTYVRNYIQNDTCTLVTFQSGVGFAADTAMVTDSTIYGSFYNDGVDTLIVTKIIGVVKQSGKTIGVQVYYNASFNTGGNAIATSTLTVTSNTTGNSTTTFTNQKIPPGNWVWLKSPTVTAGQKPTALSVSIIGYKKRI